MNHTFERLMKITPFLSLLFILIGVVMGIFSVFDHSVKLLTSSLVLILQSLILLTYVKQNINKVGIKYV